MVASIILGYALLRGWPADWHPIIRVCLAVSALVISFAIWGRAKKPNSQAAKPARPPRFLDYLTVGIAVLLVECLFLIFLSLAPPKSENLALALDESLHPEIYQTNSNLDSDKDSFSGPPGSGGSRVTSNWLFSGPGPRSLNKSDKVIPSNKPELYLFPASKGDASQLLSSDLFLRSFTLATYRAGSWFPKATVPKNLTATNGVITVPSLKTGPSVVYDVSHAASPYGQTIAVTIPDFTSIKLPNLRETAPDTFRLPTSVIEKSNYRYQVTSTLFQFDQLEKNALTPGSTPSPEYLALPSDPALREKIQTLASAFGPPTRDSLLKLRETLRSRYQYSLKIKMSEDDDPLDSFLFKTRIGYCTHFATATTMLTRAMGIPSRIAFGWSGGRYFESPNLFVFRAREAHAWTEIYLKDLGWVIFETTPAGREEGSSSLADSDEASPLAELHDDDDNTSSALLPLLKTASWLSLAAVISLLATLYFRRSSTPDSSQSPSLNILPHPPNYLSAFRRACHAHGQPMPPGRTLRSHLSLIQAPAFTHELLDYHYSVHYGTASANKATEKKLLGSLKAWEKSAPSLPKNPDITEEKEKH